jgi:hypothetical protein
MRRSDRYSDENVPRRRSSRYDEEEDLPRFRQEPPHSGLGIASFALSIFLGLVVFLLIVVAGVLEATNPGMSNNSPAVMLLGLAFIAALLGDVAALILGAAGLFQENRKKVFALLGVIFSGLLLLGSLFLILLGMLVS